MTLKLGIVQTSISNNVHENIHAITNYLQNCDDVDILLFPEGMISGYYPKDPDYLKKSSHKISLLPYLQLQK